MDRGATAAFLTELAQSKNQPVHLVQVIFDDETVYMTDAYKDIVWSGNTYLRTGNFLSFSEIEESSDLAISSITGTLSGVDQTWISAFLSKNYIDRTIKIYLALLDDNDDLISDPVKYFEGRMDSPVINEDPESGKCEVTITAASQWVDFDRVAGRRTNHEDQQIYFDGDMGFEFTSEIIKDVIWGRLPADNGSGQTTDPWFEYPPGTPRPPLPPGIPPGTFPWY